MQILGDFNEHSFEPFSCLDLVLECKQSFCFRFFFVLFFTLLSFCAQSAIVVINIRAVMSLEHARFCVEVFMPHTLLFIYSFTPIEWMKLKTIRFI